MKICYTSVQIGQLEMIFNYDECLSNLLDLSVLAEYQFNIVLTVLCLEVLTYSFLFHYSGNTV